MTDEGKVGEEESLPPLMSLAVAAQVEPGLVTCVGGGGGAVALFGVGGELDEVGCPETTEACGALDEVGCPETPEA